MAGSPSYAATPNTGVAQLDTANTNRDGTGTIVDILTGATNGTRVEERKLKATGDPADSTVVWYIKKSGTYYAYDEWDIGNPSAGSTTVPSYQETRQERWLILKNGEILAASITVALTSGKINAWAVGADF